jgi:hypothetical protein
MNIKVVDSIMGSGKTSAAITKMNEDKDSKYIFITPYLNEVDRVKAQCSIRKFVEPENKGIGKLENLHYLLGKGYNIASTHALFKSYNEYTKELLKVNQYTLILDEVFNVLEVVEISQSDLKMLFDTGIISVKDDFYIVWHDDDYTGKFSYIKEVAETNNLMLVEDTLLVWNFPIDIFTAFKDIYLLTYMFDAQIQKYYYDLHNVDITYFGTARVNGKYVFSDIPEVPPYVSELKNKIHVLDDEKLNIIGDNEYALSSSWYNREKVKRNKPMLKMLKNNLANVFIHKFKTSSDLNMWTTFKDYQVILGGKGYKKGFVPINARATNEYKNKKNLAYCTNVFFHPYIKKFFISRGVDVLEDKYALSELIQWIWRSAIRDGEDISIYIPSSRMRNLLVEYLDSL